VIDPGSARIKAGIGCKLYPTVNLWNCLGVVRDENKKDKTRSNNPSQNKSTFDDKAYFNEVQDNAWW